MYLGLLMSLEDLAVYGYITDSQVKFVLMLTMKDTLIKDQEVKALFLKIHKIYIDLCMDSFWNGEAMITNKKFIKAVQLLI